MFQDVDLPAHQKTNQDEGVNNHKNKVSSFVFVKIICIFEISYLNRTHVKAQPEPKGKNTDPETAIILEQLYSNTSTVTTLPDGSKAEVPVDGSIGLLAHGYRGIIAWRKKREIQTGSRFFSPLIEALKNHQQKNTEHERE